MEKGERCRSDPFQRERTEPTPAVRWAVDLFLLLPTPSLSPARFTASVPTVLIRSRPLTSGSKPRSPRKLSRSRFCPLALSDWLVAWFFPTSSEQVPAESIPTRETSEIGPALVGCAAARPRPPPAAPRPRPASAPPGFADPAPDSRDAVGMSYQHQSGLPGNPETSAGESRRPSFFRRETLFHVTGLTEFPLPAESEDGAYQSVRCQGADTGRSIDLVFVETQTVGQGTFGVVKRAEVLGADSKPATVVAIKRTKEDGRYKCRELNIVSSILHPNTISLLYYWYEAEFDELDPAASESLVLNLMFEYLVGPSAEQGAS